MGLSITLLVDESDQVEVRGPQNQVLVAIRVDGETGKYVVDDHASGRFHGLEEIPHSTFGDEAD